MRVDFKKKTCATCPAKSRQVEFRLPASSLRNQGKAQVMFRFPSLLAHFIAKAKGHRKRKETITNQKQQRSAPVKTSLPLHDFSFVGALAVVLS
jgi:hypothetical protein